MQLIVTKVVKIPPKTGENQTELVTGECGYIDGLIADTYNCCHLKIDKMTAGRYIVFYTAKFKDSELCRKVNSIFYSPHQVKLTRLSAKDFGTSFLNHLEHKNYKRMWDENY